MAEKVKGRIKWFSSAKGYGFITSEGVDYFMHISSLRDNDEFFEGDDVMFEIQQTDKGFAAKNISKIIGE